MENSRSILARIPLSQSDKLLHGWGYDLLQEYFLIAGHLPGDSAPVIELATGTGRMCAVLSCLFPQIISGDISLQDLPRVRERIPADRSGRVQCVQLDMEQLPFRTNALKTIVCMNTLHETDHPEACLREMIRVLHPHGTLAAGDFNRTGFDVMQRIHEAVYHNTHSEGTITLDEIERQLAVSFRSLRTVTTPLNTTFFATGKR
jgi:ubiquinone/menaquinone biosynthesis C-methylase UbiE